LTDRLGWLICPDHGPQVAALGAFADKAKADGISMSLLGMGGSSLAPSFQRLFDSAPGCARLRVLIAPIRGGQAVEREIDLPHTILLSNRRNDNGTILFSFSHGTS
jgi:hypothetical protein